MKKEYDAPKAEKIEFNYQETIIASGSSTGILKGGDGGNGCYKGNKNATTNCQPQYT